MRIHLSALAHRFARACLMGAGLLVFAPAAVAQRPATGVIEGRVFDPRRGEFLENARVTIEASRQEALTDATGHYRISNVAPGTVTLTVFYTGRDTHQEEVVVAPNAVVQRDITFAGGRNAGAGQVVKLEQFVVETSKEIDGAARAINEQRFAKNIVQVVSTDEFGTIADGSIGEFMKFLPGITSDYTGGDARRFSINGAPADNVPISMGGFDLASAAGAGTRRAVELDQISINNISRIEINRAPTPETSGSSLAGSVDFVPRSSFERNKPSYNYRVAWLMKDAEINLGRKTPGPGWGQDTYKIHPAFDVSAVVPVTKNFGFTVSGGTSLQYTPQSNVATQWRGAATATTQSATANPTGTGSWFPDTTPENPYLSTFSWRDSGKNTSRESFATSVDWRFAPRDRLTFGFSYGMLREHFATRTQTFTINRVAPGNWGPTHTWGMASTVPATGTAVNAGNIAISNGGRIRPGRTIAPSLRWLHEGPVWKSDAGIAYGNSRIQYQDIDQGAFNGMTIRRNNVQILFDDIFYLRPGTITVLAPDGTPVDPSSLDSYSLVSANSNRQKTYDTTRQAYGNIRRDFVVRDIPLGLKVGLDLKDKVRDLRGPGGSLETYTYVGADGRASTTPFTQARLVNDDSPLRFLDVPYSQRIPDFGLPQQQHVNNNKLWDDYNSNPTHWTRNANNDYIALTNFSRRAQETISSAFVRGDIALFNRRLKIVTGLRAEQTNVKAEGPLNDPTLAYSRDPSGNVVRDAAGRPVLLIPTNAGLPYSELTRIERGTKANKEYLRLFPSLNASYGFTDGLIGRVAYSQSVGRPDFNQYAGGVTLPDLENINANSRITVNNASIQAWQAETYMARLEYYFGNAGSLSVGGFIRDYKNFFQTVVSLVSPGFLETYSLDETEYGGILVSTQFNNPDVVRQHGFEVDYKQALTFLPQWARGMRFFANVSSQRAKGTDSLQDMNPFTANWGLSLTRPKFNIRINENYRGIQRRGRITGRGLEEGTYNYRPKRLYIDVTGEYYLSRKFGLFATLRNVGGATEDQKVYGPSTPAYAKFRQRDDYASLWTFGIKGTF